MIKLLVANGRLRVKGRNYVTHAGRVYWLKNIGVIRLQAFAELYAFIRYIFMCVL